MGQALTRLGRGLWRVLVWSGRGLLLLLPLLIAWIFWKAPGYAPLIAERAAEYVPLIADIIPPADAIDSARIAAAIGLLIALVLILWKVPRWQVATYRDLTSNERATLEDNFRKTVAQLVGGIALLGGFYFTWMTVNVSRESQITERFTRAIDQLGKTDENGGPLLEIRLGGIYALERIARDSPGDHWPIMEVLTAYVRERAPRDTRSAESTGDNESAATGEVWEEATQEAEPAVDVGAVLTVLRRRDSSRDPVGQRLDLSETDLREANLFRADLGRAHLFRADLGGANLQEANLRDADLQGADLREANLSWANLLRANLFRADLGGAYLPNADVTQRQLDQACGDAGTKLPWGFTISRCSQ